MPELPEVETTRRGIEPWLVGRRIESLQVREWRLRWRVPREPPGEARRPAHPRGRPAREVPAHRDRGGNAHLAPRDVGEPSHPRRRHPRARARSRGSRARFGPLPPVQRPAPLRLPPLHDRRSRAPQAARGPRGRAALRRFHGRCALEPRARAARVHQGLHHGFAHRRRRRQHLCERGALSRGDPPGPRRRPRQPRAHGRTRRSQSAKC